MQEYPVNPFTLRIKDNKEANLKVQEVLIKTTKANLYFLVLVGLVYTIVAAARFAATNSDVDK